MILTVSFFSGYPAPRRVPSCRQTSALAQANTVPALALLTHTLVAASTRMTFASSSQTAGSDRGGVPAGIDRGSELSYLNKKNATLGTWVLKVTRSDVLEYEYPWQGKQNKMTKLRVVFTIPYEGQYLLGLVKVKRDKATELEPFKVKFAKHAVFRSEAITFLADEKAQYISAPFKMVLDLRKCKLSFLIQGFPDMPHMANPPSAINQLVEIKPTGTVHRFDVMGVAEVSEARYHPVKGIRTAIVDVKLIDGTKGKSGKTADMSFAVFVSAGTGDACPQAMQQLLDAHGAVLSFFAMNATMDSGKLVFKTSPEFYWEVTEGAKASQLQSISGELQSLPEADRETLNQTFTPSGTTRDFMSCAATLSACALLDHLQDENATAAGDQIMQVNFGVVEAPEPEDTVLTKNGERLWMKVKTQDPTGRVELWMREKAALQLSGYTTKEEFLQAHAQGLVTFPFMTSFRVHSQQPDSSKKGPESDDSQAFTTGGGGSLIIVEAEEQDLASLPNESVKGLWDFVKQCSPRTDGMVPATLAQLQQSAHYPLQVDVAGVIRPCEKALVLVYATEKSKQTTVREGVTQIVTHNVTDAVRDQHEKGAPELPKYTLVTMCKSDKTSEVALSPPRSGTKMQAALCIVTAASAADTFGLQSVYLVNQDDAAHVSKLMSKLRSSFAGVSYEGSTKRPDWATTLSNPAHALKKCRKLQLHPTDKSL